MHSFVGIAMLRLCFFKKKEKEKKTWILFLQEAKSLFSETNDQARDKSEYKCQ